MSSSKRATGDADTPAALARDQSLFREVNERIRDVAVSTGSDQQWDFFCECGRLCGETVSLPLHEYARIRRKRRRFVVRPSHRSCRSSA